MTIAIGGWNEGSKKYSELCADPKRRAHFVESVVAFCKEHNFDGLDLDWEYPGKRGGSADDKDNFIDLIRELSVAFRPHGLLLTAAIGAAAPTIDVAYDIPRMYKYLDYVHVMGYDYHGKWDGSTGHNAPLYSRPNEKGQDLFLNVEYTLNYLLKKGAIAEKTVLGVPLYGRAFSLMNPHDHKMGARAKTTSFMVRTFKRSNTILLLLSCGTLKLPHFKKKSHCIYSHPKNSFRVHIQERTAFWVTTRSARS